MNERDKRRIGEQIEPGGRPKAPGRLELLQRFINTHNHDFPGDWDRIGTPAKAQEWLRKKALIAPGDCVSESQAAALRDLREALRAGLVGTHHAAGGATNKRFAARATLAVTIDVTGQTALEPTH